MLSTFDNSTTKFLADFHSEKIRRKFSKGKEKNWIVHTPLTACWLNLQKETYLSTQSRNRHELGCWKKMKIWQIKFSKWTSFTFPFRTWTFSRLLLCLLFCVWVFGSSHLNSFKMDVLALLLCQYCCVIFSGVIIFRHSRDCYVVT